MAVNPKQFIYVTRFHKHNLNVMLESYAELPEGPGILAAMLYLQESENRALAAQQALEKEKEDKKDAEQ